MFFISEDSTEACSRYLLAGSSGSSILKSFLPAVIEPVTLTLPVKLPAKHPVPVQLASMPSPPEPLPPVKTPPGPAPEELAPPVPTTPAPPNAELAPPLPPVKLPPDPALPAKRELAPPVPTTPEPPTEKPLSGSASPPLEEIPAPAFRSDPGGPLAPRAEKAGMSARARTSSCAPGAFVPMPRRVPFWKMPELPRLVVVRQSGTNWGVPLPATLAPTLTAPVAGCWAHTGRTEQTSRRPAHIEAVR